MNDLVNMEGCEEQKAPAGCGGISWEKSLQESGSNGRKGLWWQRDADGSVEFKITSRTGGIGFGNPLAVGSEEKGRLRYRSVKF